MTVRAGTKEQPGSVGPDEDPTRISDVHRPSVSSSPPLATVPAGRAAAARPLPKLPAASTPPPPTNDDGDLDIAVDELERAIAEEIAAPDRPPPAAKTEKSAKLPRIPANQLPAICTFGRFEILGRIAFGGMAEIFLGREATSLGANRMLAIKRILPHVADDPAFVEMFLDEARLAIQLNHPHICHIYEFGELEGSYFIAMEWIHGAALGKIIRRARAKGGLPPEFVARVIAQVAEALHYAHRAKDSNGQALGIVHRDVSPQNVMISYEGQVKLLDFGIAKAQSHTTKTQAGVVKGKFSYMSPQQCMGKHIDARADVFALGVVLYEALVGESLYHRPTEYETMRAVIEEPVPSIRDKKPKLPMELDAIVQKALQKEPNDRFRSAADMQSALEDWLARTGRSFTTAKIAQVMESLFEEQILAGPLVDSTPFGSSFQRRKGAEGTTDPQASNPSASSAALRPATSPSGVVPVPGELPSQASAAAAPSAVATTAMPAVVAPAPTSSAFRWLPAVIGVLALVVAGAVAAVALTRSDPPAQTITTTPLAPPPTVAPPPTPPPEEPPVPPPTAPPAAPTDGRVRFVLAVPGATVRIGDRMLGTAELAGPVSVAPGTYTVQAEHDGYRPWEGQVTVVLGEEVTVTPELAAIVARPVAPPATLSINTRPWSRVWAGSRELGTTPIGEATVPSGTVRLRIVDRDGRTFNRTVRLAPGATETVFYDLEAE
jgi:serine/threonine-protein kinase